MPAMFTVYVVNADPDNLRCRSPNILTIGALTLSMLY